MSRLEWNPERRADMALSIYEGNRYRSQGLHATFLALNIAFGAACLMIWKQLAGLLSNPIAWAAGEPVMSDPGIVDYPYVLAWSLPLVAAALGWALNSARKDRAALAVLVFPLVYFGSILLCYYFAPADWH
jgi:hypothetical protein